MCILKYYFNFHVCLFMVSGSHSVIPFVHLPKHWLQIQLVNEKTVASPLGPVPSNVRVRNPLEGLKQPAQWVINLQLPRNKTTITSTEINICFWLSTYLHMFMVTDKWTDSFLQIDYNFQNSLMSLWNNSVKSINSTSLLKFWTISPIV